MSAKLAMKVLASGLPAALKPTCVVMALFADQDGCNIYPSVGRVAYLLGVERRTAERNLQRLRALKILVPLSVDEGGRIPGGRGRSVVYAISSIALPPREPYEPLKPRSARRGCERNNPDTSVGIQIGNGDDFHSPETPTPATTTPTPTPQTPTSVSSNPDAHVAEPRHQRRTILESDLREGSIRENHRENRATRDAHTEGDFKNFKNVLEGLKESNPRLYARWMRQRERRTPDAAH